MLSTVIRAARRHWFVILLAGFGLVNFAIAAPAAAGWNDDVCMRGDGAIIPCCASCWFFCSCSSGSE